MSDDRSRDRDYMLEVEENERLTSQLEERALRCRDLQRELAEARAVLLEIQRDVLHLNRQVSTFGIAATILSKLDTAIGTGEKP